MTTRTRRTRSSANGSTNRVRSSEENRPRVRASGRAGAESGEREAQYDLLTAALLGLAIGAGTTLLLRTGPSGKRPLDPAWRAARRGARLAGRGARIAWERGVDAWDRIPREEIQERVQDYFDAARETIDDFVETELKDLRKAIRRRRRKLGF